MSENLKTKHAPTKVTAAVFAPSVVVTDRMNALDEWLDTRHARELWTAKPKGTQAEATMYAVNGWLIQVLRYKDGGWEALAPITKSNSVRDTLRDLDAFVTGKVQERHPALTLQLQEAAPVLFDQLTNLVACAELVVERWAKGDLADAVNSLRVDAAFAKEALAQALGGPDITTLRKKIADYENMFRDPEWRTWSTKAERESDLANCQRLRDELATATAPH